MAERTLLSRLATAEARYREALERMLIWQDPDECRAASLLFLDGVTEQARQVLPPALYTLFLDAAEANAELRRIEQELLRPSRESAPTPKP